MRFEHTEFLRAAGGLAQHFTGVARASDLPQNTK